MGYYAIKSNGVFRVVSNGTSSTPAEFVILTLSEYKQIKKELRHQTASSSNLYRIMREKANQQRGLKPKKVHDGYLVLLISQFSESVHEDVWDAEVNPAKFADVRKRRYALRNGLLNTIQKNVICLIIPGDQPMR